MVSVLIRQEEIIGEIEYDIINESQALINIEIHLKKSKFDLMQREREQ